MHEEESSPNTTQEIKEAAQSESTDQPVARKIPLDGVTGIGETRAENLKRAGYEDAEDVAQASEAELAQVYSIGADSARCIWVMAREECGQQTTVISEFANSLEAAREEVLDAYVQLAGAGVTPEESKETLNRLFNAESVESIVNFTEYSISYRHFLMQAGFETIADVATASIDALIEARYVGETLAKSMREKARRSYNIDPSTFQGNAASVETTTENMHQSSVPDNDTAHSIEPDESGQDEDGELIASAPEATMAAASKTDIGDEDCLTTNAGDRLSDKRYPEALKDRDQWLLWTETDDGQKIPRAPWETADPLQYVNAMDPDNWVSFSEARQWQSKLPHDLELAFTLTRDDDIVFLDLDDVIVNGCPSSAAKSLIEQADSHAAISISGGGIHIFLRGSLSEDIKSLTGPIDGTGDQTLEVYDRNHFIAMTGDHLEGTPSRVATGDSMLAELEEEFASISSNTPDRGNTEPQRSRAELNELETTSDIQDIFDAIDQICPSDIEMRSTQTKEHPDGTYSYDPSWVHSESGTRLGVLDDIWIYRKGMIALDALQLVALEEGIITDEQDYPAKDDFWEAVEALRRRGVHIPQFQPESTQINETTDLQSDTDIDREEVTAHLNYGDPVRWYLDPSDRDYQEALAIELAPTLIEVSQSLDLSPVVTYRAADLYAKGHAAGIVPGAAHESSLGAAVRIATIEADAHRPLSDIARAVDETKKSIRKKISRLLKETDLSESISATDLIVEPRDYITYMARKLEVEDDGELCELVEDLLEKVDHDGSTNPLSEVAAAFYVEMTRLRQHSITQQEISDASGLSEVTIRNNYRKYRGVDES
ncbi:helix-hairpin-helix domain-containing protein [Halovenus amylolytica]|uniref:helix-hairpin-helix domain-containing protein n=1 Tax=Halovenus amylolytica TaxID=2500550 RepID=UPI00360E8722